MPTRMETSTLILNSAQELVQARGFNAFSYADVSEVVGIRKASIHYHFPTKAKLGEALVKRYSEDFSKALEQIRESKADAMERLVALVEAYESMLGDGQICLCSMLGAGISAVPAELHEGVKAFLENATTWIAEVIREGSEAGSLACDDPEVAARALLAGLTGAQLVARVCNWEPGQFAATVVTGYVAPLKA